MIHAANLVLVLILVVNLTGLALAARRCLGSWLLARCASPLIVTVPFFLEHFAGFGSLAWLWPVSTAASIFGIAREWRILVSNWRIEAVFSGAFAYALAWRYAFPDIDVSSEKMTDLTFIANYMGGARLPPVDRWLPPFPFDMYYALQHYAAALMARILAIPPGTAYNLAICIVVAAGVTAAAGTAWLLVRKRAEAFLLTTALVVGGTGVSPFIRLIIPSPAVYSSIRFIGAALTPENATSPIGKKLVRANRGDDKSLDLPVELFSYLIALGDYHPPLSGYLLLMLALLSIASIESNEAVNAAHAVLGFTVPLTMAANAWDFPLQLFLAAAWAFYRVWSRQTVKWIPLAMGACASLFLIEPFLIRFAPHSAALHNVIRFLPRDLHTPPMLALLIFYPVIAVLALQLFFGERSRQSLAFCAIFIVLAAASELIYVDDVYSGKYERFNTVLKWWSWIYSGTLLAIGALNLRSGSRICRIGTVAVLVLICGYGRELGGYYFGTPKRHAGELDGAAWVRDDPSDRALLAFLAAQPPSIILERIPDRSYVASPALTIFAGQTAFLGWPNHEDIWRAYQQDIDRRAEDVEKLYRGDLPNSVRWLEQNRIQYILWRRSDHPAGAFEKIDGQIRESYFWRDFSAGGGFKVGAWCRK